MLFFTRIIAALAGASLISVAHSAPVDGEAAAPATITAKPRLVRRDQAVLTDSVWTSTSSGVAIKITPTLIDGVTISASPITSSATPWVSLDGSGIPIAVTPTVSGSSTVSASPTPTDSDYPDPTGVPPVLRCWGDRVPTEGSSTLGYPFCTALNGSEWLVGETYWITWDPTNWGVDDITRVKLQMISYPIKDDDDPIWTSDYINNNNGYYPFTVLSSYKRSNTAGYFYLMITPLVNQGTTAKNPGTQTGPMLRFISSTSDAVTSITRLPSDNGIDSTSSSSSKSSNNGSNTAKIVAPAVVVPVVVAIAIALAVLYWMRSKRVNKDVTGGSTSLGAAIGGAIKLKRRSGYAEGSKAQRTGTTIQTANAPDTDVETDIETLDHTDANSSIATETIGDNPFRS